MRCVGFMVGVLVALFPLADVAAQDGYGDGSQREPLIKFLDDLRGFPHGACRRDPFEERIETERHDFTQSTKTVGCGVVQIEAGYTYFYRDHDDEIEQSHVAPETLLRVGLSDDIEFRVRWTYAWREIDGVDQLDSAEDLVWSLKLGVTDYCGWVPESALEIRSSLPTGGSAWTVGRVEAGFDYIYDWRLADGWTLYGSTGLSPSGLGDFTLLPDEPARDHFLVWSQSVAMGVDLTDSTTLYSEWFGLYSHALEDEFSVSFYNVGVDYYLSDDLVLDVRIGVGLTDDSEDFFAGVGGGYRF